MASSSKDFTDIDSAFDDIFMAEERFQSDGFKEGEKVGKLIGEEEGYKLGWEKGSAIGSEIGFYIGFSETLLKEEEIVTSTKPRVLKVLEQLNCMATQFPITDPLYPQLFEKIQAIRAKYKQVCSLLGIESTSGKSSDTPKGESF